MYKQLFVVIVVIYLLLVSPQADENIETKSDGTVLPPHQTTKTKSSPTETSKNFDSEKMSDNSDFNEVYSSPVRLTDDSPSDESTHETPEDIQDNVPPFTIQDQLNTSDVEIVTSTNSGDSEPSVAIDVVLSDAVMLNESSDTSRSSDQHDNEESFEKMQAPSSSRDNLNVLEPFTKTDQDQNAEIGEKPDPMLSDAEPKDMLPQETQNKSASSSESETPVEVNETEPDISKPLIKEESVEKSGKEQPDATLIKDAEHVTVSPDQSTQPLETESSSTDIPINNKKESSEEKLADETTDKVPETSETSDEKPVKLEVDDIQSFEEWKKNQIQSQEEAASTETNGPPHRTIRTKKTQMNYASQDCGAKVLTHNPEAKHVGAILDENKDLYMLNPCSGQIWFVVELCEPIQVQQVQLANLELFSSMPHLFDISISERFPARDWRLLGIFEARNERSVQTFVPKRDEILFAKYIKFQMKSHFGNEHFCPLTLVRVLGVSMVEEYDDSVEEKVVKDQANQEPNTKDNTEDVSIEMDNAAEKPIEPPTGIQTEEGGSIGKMFNIVKNAVDNLLGNGKAGAENATTANSTAQTDAHDEGIDPDWESPITLVTNRSEVESSSKSSTRPPLVTLLEAGDGQEIVDFSQSSPPLYSLKFLSNISPENFGTKFCWFLEFMYRVSILSCVVQPHKNHTSAAGAFPLVADKKFSKNFSQFPSRPPDVEKIPNKATNLNSTVIEDEQRSEKEENSDPLPKVDSSVHQRDVPNSTMQEEPENNATEDTEKNVDDSGPISKVEEPPPDDSAQKPNLDSSKTLDDGLNVIKKVFVGESKPKDHVCDSTANEKKSSNESKNVSEEKIDVETTAQPDNTEDTETQDKQAEAIKDAEDEANTDPPIENPHPVQPHHEDNDQHNDAAENSNVVVDNISPPSPSTENHEPDTAETTPPSKEDDGPLSPPPIITTAIPSVDEQNANKAESVEVEEEQVVINPGTNQKESVLMRLSNRIRTLEQNLSLSSAYLENLSQRYKRQMDEMQRAFNKTQTRLSETSRVAEENNMKHSEAITIEKEKTENLKKKLQDMTESLEHLNRCMIARHLCLMVIESVVLIIICVTCFGIRQIRLVRRLEKTEQEIELLLTHQSSVANGHAKLAQQGPKTRSCNGHAKREDSDQIDKSSQRKLLNVNVKSLSGNPRPSAGHVSSLTPQRRKSIKTPSSPFKRKTNHQGKIQKYNAKVNSGLSSVAGTHDTWPSNLGKNQKLLRPKKYLSKSDSRLDTATKHAAPACSTYANGKVASTAGCGTTALPWRNQFFTGISGKAR